MWKLSWWFVVPVWWWGSAAGAQDVASGPAKGAPLAALTVYDATGLHKGKTVDYAAERKGKPTIYVFVSDAKWDRPMARFLKKLEEAIHKETEEVYVVGVWLTENQEKTREYLPLAQQSLQFQATALTCFPGEKAGPKGWNVNADAHLTVVVAHKNKVAATFGYRSVNETDVPAVRDALKKARSDK